MFNLVRSAVAGAIALGGLMVLPAETSAMPIDAMRPAVVAGSTSTAIQPVWWRYGYGWRRPFFYRRPFAYGWRRPFFYGRPFAYGWRRPFFYRRPFYGYRRFY